MIALTEITEENFYQVIHLELTDEQQSFVAPNVRSLAECYLYRNNNDVFPYAICANGVVVGFALLDVDDEKQSITIWRIMIDKKHQGKGYGRQAMEKIEQRICLENKYTHLYTSYSLKNVQAKGMYESLGYEAQGLNEHNEMVVLKKLM